MTYTKDFMAVIAEFARHNTHYTRVVEDPAAGTLTLFHTDGSVTQHTCATQG